MLTVLKRARRQGQTVESSSRWALAPLRVARNAEAFALLIGGRRDERETGPKLTCRFESLPV
jgi:hypothetical protein